MTLTHHEVRLVPSPLWGVSLAALCTAKTWDTIRKKYEFESDCQCRFGKDPGFHRQGPLHGHERWRYSDGVAILEDIWAICGSCHDMLHPGRVLASGGREAYERVRQAYAKRCGFTIAQAEEQYDRAFITHEVLSRHASWTIDISLVQASMPLRAKKGALGIIKRHRWIGSPFGSETHVDARGS